LDCGNEVRAETPKGIPLPVDPPATAVRLIPAPLTVQVAIDEVLVVALMALQRAEATDAAVEGEAPELP
jgi:hypothetical protein